MSLYGSARYLSSCVCRRSLGHRCFTSTAAVSNVQDATFDAIHKTALALGPSERARLLSDLQELNAKEALESYGGMIGMIEL
jgi:hypothetical protein